MGIGGERMETKAEMVAATKKGEGWRKIPEVEGILPAGEWRLGVAGGVLVPRCHGGDGGPEMGMGEVAGETVARVLTFD